MPGFDLKQVSRNDKGVVAAGILAFIVSFLPYYGLKVEGHTFWSVSSWHSYAILGNLLILLATLISAARVSGAVDLPKLPVGVNLLVLGLSGLGTLLVIVRAVDLPSASVPGASVGIRYGGYLLFIAGIAQVVFAGLNFRSSGEKLAWDATAMSRPAAAAPATGYAPPAGYAAPAQPAAPAAEQPTTYPSGDAGSPTP